MALGESESGVGGFGANCCALAEQRVWQFFSVGEICADVAAGL